MIVTNLQISKLHYILCQLPAQDAQFCGILRRSGMRVEKACEVSFGPNGKKKKLEFHPSYCQRMIRLGRRIPAILSFLRPVPFAVKLTFHIVVKDHRYPLD